MNCEIDLIAEREALAISKLAAMTDTEVPVHQHVHNARLIERARQLGITPPPHPRYPRAMMLRWWLEALDAIAKGKVPAGTRYEIVTVADIRKREQRRKSRLAKLARLKRFHDRVISIAEAIELTGLSQRQLQRIALERKIPAVRAVGPGAPWAFRLSDVRRYLERRLAA